MGARNVPTPAPALAKPAPPPPPPPRRGCVLVWRDGALVVPHDQVTLTVLQFAVLTQPVSRQL